MKSGVLSQTPIIILILILIALLLITLTPFTLWISSLAAGAPVHLYTLVRMRLQRIKPEAIVKPFILAKKAAIHVDLKQLEKHYIEGGDLEHTIKGLIAAKRTNIPLSFAEAARLNIAGQDVLQKVKKEVNLKEDT